MLFADDERDEDLENEDADFDEENSDEDEEDEEDGDDSDNEDSDEEDEEDEDDKPVTRKELKELLKTKNRSNARDRVTSKKKGPVTKQPSDLEKTVAELKKESEQRALLEKKRDFADEHRLSRKQTDLVFRLTKRPTAKFLNQPHVKAALDAIKQSENIARNTPSGSGKRGKSPDGGKKWTELPSDERQSGFADRRRSILASKQR
jgi:hypothetical protein